MARGNQGALVNAMLIRWASGFTEAVVIDNGFGRIEGFLSLGNVLDPSVARSAAIAVLGPLSNVIPAVTAELQPVSPADAPYTGFHLGDTVSAPNELGTPQTLRVQGISVTEDAEGNPIFAPEVGTLAAITETNLQNWLARMAAGTLAGSSTIASPAPPASPIPAVIPPSGFTVGGGGPGGGTGGGGSPGPPGGGGGGGAGGAGSVMIYDFPGILAIATSPPVRPKDTINATGLSAALGTAGTTNTVVNLLKNGTSVATVTLTSGSTYARTTFSAVAYASQTDIVTIQISSAGSGAADLGGEIELV